MIIKKEQDGSSLTVYVVGRLDTMTSPELDREMKASLEGVEEVIFDFENLDYVSSAGLRVLLAARKRLGNAGNVKIRNVNEGVYEVFSVTGFSDLLDIERK